MLLHPHKCNTELSQSTYAAPRLVVCSSGLLPACCTENRRQCRSIFLQESAHAASAHDASQLYPVPLDDDEGEDDDIWAAVLPRGPPAATPTAQPGMFGNEQYNEAQLHSLVVFKYLLVFVAALESFAHGANDTGNATGALSQRAARQPIMTVSVCSLGAGLLTRVGQSLLRFAGAFSAVWLAHRNGLTSCDLDDTPLWVMPAGGLFVCLGVYVLGHRVIRTMGFGLASINFLRGFCIEFASTAAVVVATVIGMPVSTTHCQVGAVVFVGWTAFGRRHVQWGMLGRIAVTWVVTLPLAGGLAAAILWASEALIRR